MRELMRRVSLSQVIISLAVLSFLIMVNLTAFAQNSPSVLNSNREDSLRQAIKSWGSSDTDSLDRYIAVFRDLNDDGVEDAIVYVIGNDVCGSGGCPTLVFARQGASWRLVADISVTRLPIRVMTKKSYGWRSIGVWVQGGGINPGYEAELDYDGRAYPQNSSGLPAIRIKGIAGEILIPDNEKLAKPLY